MTGTALTPAAPIPPPVPDNLDAVLRRMRFPYLRKAAPDVLATARAQRWDPAEVIRILLEEEIRGRDEAGRRIRRKAAGLPAGKPSRPGGKPAPPSRCPPSTPWPPWNGSPARRISASPARRLSTVQARDCRILAGHFDVAID